MMRDLSKYSLRADFMSGGATSVSKTAGAGDMGALPFCSCRRIVLSGLCLSQRRPVYGIWVRCLSVLVAALSRGFSWFRTCLMALRRFLHFDSRADQQAALKLSGVSVSGRRLLVEVAKVPTHGERRDVNQQQQQPATLPKEEQATAAGLVQAKTQEGEVPLDCDADERFVAALVRRLRANKANNHMVSAAGFFALPLALLRRLEQGQPV
jgi:hypothetical protein